MSDIEIIIRLPEELVERAKSAGLSPEAQTEHFIEFMETEIKRGEAMDELEGSLTPEEIEEELARAKAERIARYEAQVDEKEG